MNTDDTVSKETERHIWCVNGKSKALMNFKGHLPGGQDD